LAGLNTRGYAQRWGECAVAYQSDDRNRWSRHVNATKVRAKTAERRSQSLANNNRLGDQVAPIVILDGFG
jgi:hypothetical protein